MATKKKVVKQQTASAPEAAQLMMVPWENLIPTYATREENPNKMTDTEFNNLVRFMEKEGVIQSIFVTPAKEKGKYQVYDGHHRYWAAEKLGKLPLPAVLRTTSGPRSVLIGVGLNRNRGELDLTATSAEISRIMDETGWLADQVAPITGFAIEEIEAFTSKVLDGSEEDVLEELSIGGSEDDDKAASDKPYVLEITFANRDDYKLARRKLKKAAGKGGDLSIGLLKVLGEDDV